MASVMNNIAVLFFQLRATLSKCTIMCAVYWFLLSSLNERSKNPFRRFTGIRKSDPFLTSFCFWFVTALHIFWLWNLWVYLRFQSKRSSFSKTWMVGSLHTMSTFFFCVRKVFASKHLARTFWKRKKFSAQLQVNSMFLDARLVFFPVFSVA